MGLGEKGMEFYRDELWQVLDTDGNKREIWTLHFKKNLSPFYSVWALPLHRWFFLPLLLSSLNCFLPNPLFFLLIPAVFSLSPYSAPHVPVCLLSFLLMSSSQTLSAPSLSSFILLSFALRRDTWLLRQRVVTDAVTKLPIKSMFNSNDCRPLTEKVEAFHL